MSCGRDVKKQKYLRETKEEKIRGNANKFIKMFVKKFKEEVNTFFLHEVNTLKNLKSYFVLHKIYNYFYF